MLLSSSLIAVMALASSSPAQSFSTPAFQMQRRQTTTSLHRVQTTSHPTSALKMSDFGSAMPEKPELSMKEKLMESATTFIVDLEARLADGVDPPPEMEALKAARDADSDEKTLRCFQAGCMPANQLFLHSDRSLQMVQHRKGIRIYHSF